MQQLITRSWPRLKSALQPVRRIVFPVTPRARNDYATHVPVLIGLARMRRIERVLEFGCGHYSTKTFLNRSAFPHLKELHSVENDVEWGETIRAAVKNDNRCEVKVVSGAMCDAVPEHELDSFDLVLVDDSTSAEQRVATIQTLSVLRPRNPWFVIHDYEIGEYRIAATGFKHRFAFKAYLPQTGVVFNGSTARHAFKALDQRLKANRARLEPDDVAGWIRVLHE
jgi:hypothetical protein